MKAKKKEKMKKTLYFLRLAHKSLSIKNEKLETIYLLDQKIRMYEKLLKAV